MNIQLENKNYKILPRTNTPVINRTVEESQANADDFQKILLKTIFLNSFTESSKLNLEDDQEESLFDYSGLNGYDEILQESLSEKLAKDDILGLKKYYDGRR